METLHVFSPYRGPKPPFKWSHIYQYQVFVLDCTLELSSSSRKKIY